MLGNVVCNSFWGLLHEGENKTGIRGILCNSVVEDNLSLDLLLNGRSVQLDSERKSERNKAKR